LRAKDLPFWVEKGIMGWMGNGAGLVISAVLIYLIVGAIRSYSYDEKPVNLAFPFKRGLTLFLKEEMGKPVL
jgi:hypothetical protein